MDDVGFGELAVSDKKSDKPANLTDLELDIMCYVEQKYWESGEVPTVEKTAIDLKIDLQRVKAAWKKETFSNALIARGLKWDSRGDGILTAQQLILVNLLLSVGDNVSLRQKLKAVNVSQQQYNTWLRDAAFQNYLRLRTEQTFEVSDTEVFQSLAQAAKDGDVPAMKLFLELRGHYNPRMQIDVNIETVIYKVVDVIARHVKDETIIEAIASELDELNVNTRSLSRAPIGI